MNAADRLQMFANFQRATMRRMLEAIVPLRSTQAYGLIPQVGKGDLRQLAPLRTTLERHHVIALKAFDQDVGPLLELARQHLREDEWRELLNLANGETAPRGVMPRATQHGARSAAIWG